jgi:hypothetical protein
MTTGPDQEDLTVLLSKDEQHAWDRFVAAAMQIADVDPSHVDAIADARIAARRARYPGQRGLEAIRIQEARALKALASAVERSLAGEPTDLLAAFIRVESARRVTP